MERRQTLIEDWRQETLDDAHVFIGGAGALGSTLAVALARLGVGEITIADPDGVEEHNSANQTYTMDDIGKPKAKALAEQVSHISPEIRVVPKAARMQDLVDLEGDVLMGCFDNVAARHYISSLAVKSGRTLVDGGIDRYYGVVKSIIPGKTACQSCYPTLPASAPSASCSSDPIPSTYLTASMTSNMMAMHLVEILKGNDVPSYVRMDIRERRMETFNMKMNPECELCGVLHA